MENEGLRILLGKTVVDFDLTSQDAGFLFEGGITLNIYNKFSVKSVGEQNEKMLVGAVVVNIEETKESVLLEFDVGEKIEVDLKDCAYTSPEAMQLRVPGRPVVIWN
ncbi:hypothetical protein ACS0ZG_37655 [Burkholderia gladioli]|uniref:hypothetical protein n=1 Tax=Burkholderia gladioli TaxID=28095 RepID=UPI000FDAFCEB|nr:hypothetical protein [Burkholderia gladioli]